MIKKDFKEVFELSKKLQEKHYKDIYDELSKSNKKIGTFEEFIERERQELNKEIPEDKKVNIEDAYISKDIIEKDNTKIYLYLFHYTHFNPLEFDENYKPLPLTDKELCEYGATIAVEDEKDHYDISGAFGGVEDDEHIAKDKYNALKLRIEKMSEDKLLNDMKKDILKQLND